MNFRRYRTIIPAYFKQRFLILSQLILCDQLSPLIPGHTCTPLGYSSMVILQAQLSEPLEPLEPLERLPEMYEIVNSFFKYRYLNQSFHALEAALGLLKNNSHPL